MNSVNIRLIDSTILLVFLGTMRHRKATVVAEEMGLTQPAVSHALKRLRAIYGDPLFLRRAHGLEPTAFAKELEPRVRSVVRLLSETLDAPQAFDPRSATFDLRIGAFDYELALLIPRIVAELRSASPNINVHAFPFHNQEALDALIDGQIDLALGYFEFPLRSEKHFVAAVLCDEHYVLAGRRGHPLFDKKLTLARVAAASHVLISPHGPIRDMVDQALHLQGYRRNVTTIVPSLFSALSIIESSDLVATLPRRAAESQAERFDIVSKPLPIAGGAFQLHAIRHIRDAGNPFHLWLLDILRAAMSDNPA